MNRALVVNEGDAVVRETSDGAKKKTTTGNAEEHADVGK